MSFISEALPFQARRLLKLAHQFFNTWISLESEGGQVGCGLRGSACGLSFGGGTQGAAAGPQPRLSPGPALTHGHSQAVPLGTTGTLLGCGSEGFS